MTQLAAGLSSHVASWQKEKKKGYVDFFVMFHAFTLVPTMTIMSIQMHLSPAVPLFPFIMNI